METKVILADIYKGKILFPKPIRKFHKKSNNKRKKRAYQKNNNAELFICDNLSKFDLENITIDEINNDFLSLQQNQEEIKCFDEIYDILSKENIFRPKNKNNPVLDGGIINNFFQIL